ncbi:unnamed protein product [Polarella glacialis]|uniref:Uncharacterized protein n=1 Tax=Polarella glacialis TaxID=89957 RepID=A0A813IYR4_POLGL|nr:unnamed protein product [Polarella glacialis]
MVSGASRAVRRGLPAALVVAAAATASFSAVACTAASRGRVRPGEEMLSLLDRGVTEDAEGRVFATRLRGLRPSLLRERERRLLEGGPLLDSRSRSAFRSFGHCSLATEEVYSLDDRELEESLARLLYSTAAAARAQGFDVQVSRFDLFHGHLFLRAHGCGLGILLHAAEYPARCKDSFPVNLGFCQEGSTVQYSDHRMRYRNILVLFSTGLPSQGFVLDASSALVEALIPEYARAPLYTLYEEALGEPMADVYFLPRASCEPDASSAQASAASCPGHETGKLGWIPRGKLRARMLQGQSGNLQSKL